MLGLNGMMVEVKDEEDVGVIVSFELNRYMSYKMYDNEKKRQKKEDGNLIEEGENKGSEKWDGEKIRWDLMGDEMNEEKRKIKINIENKKG